MLDDPKKTVAAVCHGPAGLLTASRSDGTWACADRQLTGFSNLEETQAGFSGNAPWLLEDRLRIAGARYTAQAPWTQCRRRPEPRHGSAELFSRCHRRGRAETPRCESLNTSRIDAERTTMKAAVIHP
jgi:hypothetical protein